MNETSKDSLIGIDPGTTDRGGCLDGLLSVITFGHYGIVTTVRHGFLDEYSGEVFRCDPTMKSLLTGEPVAVLDMEKTKHVDIKLVKLR